MQINEPLLDIEGIKNSRAQLLDLFIRRTAVLTSTPEYLVEKIVKDQWRNANKMTQPGRDISEINFCNLGTFFISKAKARKKLERIEKKIVEGQESTDMNEEKKEQFIKKYTDTRSSIKTKLKINQDEC